jgi:type IV pilus assembly protein PilX
MNNKNLIRLQFKSRQQGFLLITALVFMIILTLIVISAVNITTSDEKIARNSRDKDIAFAAAEAALRDAELYVSGAYHYPYSALNAISFTNSCANALCDLRLTTPPPVLDQIDFFSGSNALGNNSMTIGTVTLSPTINGVSAQPRYLLEILNSYSDPGNPNAYVYRITAQATGRSPNTRVTLQELYTP